MKTRINYDEAFLIGQSIMGAMNRLDIVKVALMVGSMRRQKPTVGDIEFLIFPKYGPPPEGSAVQLGMFQGHPDVNLFEAQLELFTEFSGLHPGDKNGPKLKNFTYEVLTGDQPVIPVEVFICEDPDSWGLLLALRTGPADLTEWLAKRAKKLKGITWKDAHLWDGDGNMIPTPTEASFFNALQLPTLQPQRRTLENYQKAAMKATK